MLLGIYTDQRSVNTLPAVALGVISPPTFHRSNMGRLNRNRAGA